jgi:membrane-associated phospholipid phosphatase
MSTTSLSFRRHATRPSRQQSEPGRQHDTIAPVLDAPGNRLPHALTRVAGPAHPVGTFFVGIFLAYVLVAGLSILIGLLLTDVVLQSHAVAGGDERFVGFLARHRTGTLTEASLIGSIMAGGVVLPIVAGIGALGAAIGRQWRLAGFFLFALAVESASYRTTTLVIHRDRPPVHRLENLPVNASYPSGHTAAAIAVYCGIALLLTSRLTQNWQRIPIWAIAVSIPLYVALARMYRGMHHPLDCLGGVVVGIATLAAVVLVCRAAGIAADER